MPSRKRIKTYGRSNCIHKPVSPLKITAASTVIDALFSENIKKRKLCEENNTKENLLLQKPKTFKLSTSLFTDDSLKVKINTTFDNLLQGPIYNQVNVYNKSSFSLNCNSDISKPKNSLNKKHSTLKRKRKKNLKLHIYDNWEESYNNVSSAGKVQKKKYNTRKLKKTVNKVISITDSRKHNPNFSKKLYSYLDKSINYSLIIDKESKSVKLSNNSNLLSAQQCTSATSTSRLLTVSNNKNDSSIFRHGFRRFLRAENTPRFIHSSTPIAPRFRKIDEKLNVSPISDIKSKLNFTKSLFESKKVNDFSLVQNTVNKDANSVILINSTVSEIIESENLKDLQENIVRDDSKSKSVILVDEDNEMSKCSHIEKEKLYDKEIINIDITEINGLKLEDPKLNTKAIVLLENIIDIQDKNNCIQSELVPVVLIERFSMTKYVKNTSQISDKSQSFFKKLNDNVQISQQKKSKVVSELKFDSDNSNKHSNILNTEIVIRRPLFTKDLTKIIPDTKNEKLFNKYKKRPGSSKNLNNISSNEEIIEVDNSEKSLFSSSYSDVIETSINDIVPICPKFITNRKIKKPVCFDIETDYKPLNIKSTSCEKLYQCNVKLIRIEDDAELQKYTNNLKTNANSHSGRKTCVNDTDNCKDLSSNGIFLKPGKKWFRSLSILRRTNIHELEHGEFCNKGRKWRDSIFEVFNQQERSKDATNVYNNESASNAMKQKIYSNELMTLGIRKSLKIVNISVADHSLLLQKSLENKSGYVSTLAHVSISENFNKLPLSTHVDDREETARQIILKRCNQTAPIPFDDCYSSRTLKKCRKIGEGVYGEVFMYKSVDNKCKVMKVIPIEGNLAVNGEHQKKFEEIISEIIIASELSNLRKNNEFCTNGFAELLQVFCVQGKYPQHLVDLWDSYDEERGSENDSPEIFTDDQLYIVLELTNGGQDLEAYRFNNAEQSHALFAQVVCSLAVAESALQFEHRDMHWGNILISPTDEAITSFLLNGRELEIATKGVKLSIIDFTLSRMTYNSCCIYNDLALDPDLFTATGDYQFDVYRLMKQRNLNDWQVFEPYSNILWLDYALEKMILHVRYLRGASKTHKNYIRRLSQIRKKILNFNSATELLNSDVFSHVFL